METPSFISKLKCSCDKYSVDKVWTKIYCHFYFRGITLIFCELEVTDILKSSEWGLEKKELPWEQNFYSRRCFSCKPIISLSSFNGLRCKLTKIAIFIYLILNWLSVWRHQSPHLHIFHISNVNISGTKRDICKRQTAFLIFYGILCNWPKKWRAAIKDAYWK